MEWAAVYKAYKKCAKGKRKSGDCTKFESRLGQELHSLHSDLNRQTYKPVRGRCFIVTNPRMREIWASTFRDRVVHHLIVEPLEKIWEPRFHPKSFACRKNKGLHAAIMDFKKQVRRISQGGVKTVWVLQLDIASFFFTVDRDILKALFLSEMKDSEIIRLIEILFSIDPRRDFRKVGDLGLFKEVPPSKSWHSRGEKQGIPIGNLTSQFGANLYLNALDHFVTRALKPKGYLRYMDDLTLLDTDSERLAAFASAVGEWLVTHRRQNLNPTKTVLKPLTAGIDYLGFRLKQIDAPKDPLLVLPQAEKKWKLVEETRRLTQQEFRPIKPHEISFFVHHRNRRELQKLNSRLGMMTHTSSYRFRRKTVSRLCDYFETHKPDTPLTVRKDYRSIRL